MFEQIGLVPWIVAASSLPAFVIARLLARDRRRLARLMNLVGVIVLVGAAALGWAAGDERRTLQVVLAMALAVNGVGAVLLIVALSGRRGNGPR